MKSLNRFFEIRSQKKVLFANVRGDDMGRLEELKSIFEKVDEDKRMIVAPLLTDVVELEERLQMLRGMAHIEVHPRNPMKQRVTPAGKLYKEQMQLYLNAIKVLQSTLSRYSVEEEDAFEKWLAENS